MADPTSLEKDAADFLREAEKFEAAKNYERAVFYYTETVEALLNAKAAGSSNPKLMEQAHAYTHQAEQLAKLRGFVSLTWL